MALFGSSKRSAFTPTPYGNTRRPRRIPRWLVLILTGIVLGGGGLLFLQKSYGPIRLTVEQSEQLHYDLNSANLDKQRLQSDLNRQNRELATTQTNLGEQSAKLKEALENVVKLKNDVQLFVDAMPPDPRGTSPGIRAASFKNDNGQLAYQMLLMQDKENSPAYQGQIEFVVAGRYPSGKTGNVTLPAFDIDLQHYDHIHGSIPLPQAFTARQVTVRVISRATKKLSATRTLHVTATR